MSLLVVFRDRVLPVVEAYSVVPLVYRPRKVQAGALRKLHILLCPIQPLQEEGLYRAVRALQSRIEFCVVQRLQFLVAIVRAEVTASGARREVGARSARYQLGGTERARDSVSTVSWSALPIEAESCRRSYQVRVILSRSACEWMGSALRLISRARSSRSSMASCEVAMLSPSAVGCVLGVTLVPAMLCMSLWAAAFHVRDAPAGRKLTRHVLPPV